MSIYANTVHLMGNLTRDPELLTLDRNGSDGQPIRICNFGLATNRNYTNQQTKKKAQETTYVDLTAFGRQAEIVNEYCEKGSPLYIQGYLRLESWEKDGVRNQKLKVVAERISLLGPGNGNGAPQPEAEAANG